MTPPQSLNTSKVHFHTGQLAGYSLFTHGHCCVLLQVVMTDAVIAADGHTYERAAMEAWLQSHDTSPITQQPLAHGRLVPNMIVKTAIAAHEQQHH